MQSNHPVSADRHGFNPDIMEKERIIERIMLEDFRHNQLIAGLEKLGMNVDPLHLNLLAIIGYLLDIECVSNEMGDIYIDYLSKAAELPIEDLGKNLRPLVSECLAEVLECALKEKQK